jgi:hypothetical protein
MISAMCSWMVRCMKYAMAASPPEPVARVLCEINTAMTSTNWGVPLNAHGNGLTIKTGSASTGKIYCNCLNQSMRAPKANEAGIASRAGSASTVINSLRSLQSIGASSTIKWWWASQPERVSRVLCGIHIAMTSSNWSVSLKPAGNWLNDQNYW